MNLIHSSKVSPVAIAVVLATIFTVAMAEETYDVDASEEEQIEKATQAYNARQADDSTKVVCGLETQKGTRFKRKVCRTVATTETNERNARYFMRSKKPILENERVTTRY